MEAVVLLSGGLDSTTLLYHTLQRVTSLEVLAVSFNYGQRHKKELESAQLIAEKNNVDWAEVDLRSLGEMLHGSALSDPSVRVPHGHYAAETMVQTIVPNRNAIMLSAAAGAAIGCGADRVMAAMHAGDHAIYPDCRPEFILAFNTMLVIATESNVQVEAPFIHMSKMEIVSRGTELNVPYDMTWSCYEGGDIHCGKCGTCVERAEAFYLAGVHDPTEYADPDFWREETANAGH